jgi:hypothetical protein
MNHLPENLAVRNLYQSTYNQLLALLSSQLKVDITFNSGSTLSFEHKLKVTNNVLDKNYLAKKILNIIDKSNEEQIKNSRKIRILIVEYFNETCNS